MISRTGFKEINLMTGGNVTDYVCVPLVGLIKNKQND
jgi:hypothetical protein